MFDEVAGTVAVSLLEPWFAVCKAWTPRNWQTQGNIPLGLTFIISGVAVYSMGISLAGMIILSAVRTLTKRLMLWAATAVSLSATVADAALWQQAITPVSASAPDISESRLHLPPVSRLTADQFLSSVQSDFTCPQRPGKSAARVLCDESRPAHE